MKRTRLRVLTAVVVSCLLSVGAEADGAEDAPVVFIVPTTHMDMDFTRPPSKSMALYDDFIMQAIKTLENDKSLRYSITIASAVEHFLKHHPQMQMRLAALVKNGQIEICANWSNPHWSELPDELIVREIAGTKWWIHDRFGVWLTVADNGELADPTPQLAQVLACCQVPFFHSAKIMQFNDKDYDGLAGVFRYLALDGTSVLWDSNFYNMSKSKQNKLWDWSVDKEGIEKVFLDARIGSVALFTAGGGQWDDSLPNFAKLSEFVKAWNANDRCRGHGKLRFATYAEYFKAIAGQPAVKNVPLWTGQTEHGELLYRWGWDKCRDRAIFANVMKDAETLASLCEMYGLMTYPRQKLDDLWLKMAYVSTHNWGNRDRRTKEYPTIAAKALKEARQILQRCTELIADACGGDVEVNTLCFKRNGIGGLGWKKRAGKSPSGTKTPAMEIENHFYRVKAKETVGLVSIYDRQNGRELFKCQDNGSILTVRSSYEEGMGAERMTIPKKMLSREEGELSSKILKMHDAEFVCEQIVGDSNSLVLSGLIGTAKCQISVCLVDDRIDISLATKNKYVPPEVVMDVPRNFAELLADGPMFFASIEFDMPADAYARVSVPFGSLTMPTSMPRIAKGASFSTAAAGVQSWYAAFNERWHIPLQSIVGARAATPYWLDMYDAKSDFGITWAQYAPYANMFRDADKPNRFLKSLWRAVSDGGCYLWSFRTHKGPWRQAKPARFAEEINHPIILTMAKSPQDVVLPAKAGLLEVEPENVIATCFKKAHDGRGYILRLCETADKSTLVTVKTSGVLSGATLEQTNMIENVTEERISGVPLKVMVRPFEIKTLRLIP